MPWISKKKLQQMNNSINHMASIIEDYEGLIIACDETYANKEMPDEAKLATIYFNVRDTKISTGYSVKKGSK